MADRPLRRAVAERTEGGSRDFGGFEAPRFRRHLGASKPGKKFGLGTMHLIVATE